MFKLIKINNSTSNVPEIVKLKKLANMDFAVGEAISISNERAVRCFENARPEYITASSAKEKDLYVYAYKVTCNMVFEVDYYNTQTCKMGNKHSLNVEGDSPVLSLGMSDDAGVATIIDVVSKRKAIIIFE